MGALHEVFAEESKEQLLFNPEMEPDPIQFEVVDNDEHEHVSDLRLPVNDLSPNPSLLIPGSSHSDDDFILFATALGNWIVKWIVQNQLTNTDVVMTHEQLCTISSAVHNYTEQTDIRDFPSPHEVLWEAQTDSQTNVRTFRLTLCFRVPPSHDSFAGVCIFKVIPNRDPEGDSLFEFEMI
jgi:hypothetical protein